MRIVIFAGLLGLAISSASAQSTDVVQRATFELKGTMQTASGAKTVRFGNKGILDALNASGTYHFGPKATLLFVINDDQPTGLIVQDGKPGQTTNTDVSAFFAVSEVGEPVRSSDGSTEWETWHLGFDNGSTNAETGFELWASTTIGAGAVHGGRSVTDTNAQPFQASVRGAGRLNGAVTVFSGTISSVSFVSRKN